MSKEISIIVPVYNVEKYLKNCIDSILNQTYTEFELIMVNDGSTDNSGEICDEYSRIDPRTRVIHKSNGGLSSARNAGLEVAKGKYILFIDSDDYIHSKMLEILYNNMNTSSSDIVICGFKYVEDSDSGDEEYIDIGKIDKYQYTNLQALEELYTQNGVTFVVAWNKLYNRKLFEGLKYEEGRTHEDEFIIHNLLYRSNAITYVPIKLYYYRQTKNSITRAPINIKWIDELYGLEQRMIFFKNMSMATLKNKAEYRFIKNYMMLYYKIKKEIPDSERELKKLKKMLRKNLFSLVKNPLFSYKEKLVWFLFILNTNLYLKISEK